MAVTPYVPQTWHDEPVEDTPTSAARFTNMEFGIAQALVRLVPTAVKTANYTAVPGDLVVANMSGAAWAVTLPSAPPNHTVIGAKIVTGGSVLTINRGGADVFNKTGGSTSLTLMKQFQEVWLLYETGIWYVVNDGFPPDFTGVQATVSANGTGVEAAHNPFDATGGVRTATLPTPTSPGRIISFEKVDSSANAVNITGNIDGVAAQTHALATQNETIVFVSSATSWWRLASHRSKAALDAAYLVGQRLTLTPGNTITTGPTNATTTVTDVGGNGTFAFTAVAGQTYEIRVNARGSNNTAGDGVLVQLTDNSNVVLDSTTVMSRSANDAFAVVLVAEVSPSAGSQTYKLRFAAVTGGTAALPSSATAPLRIMVTRIG